MKIHCLTHVPFEDAAALEIWAEDRGHPLTYTRLYDNDPLPSLDSFDLLTVMGGLMNVYEEDRYPWLVEEKKFLRKVIDSRKRVLGICLGAQLLADVLGGKVTQNPCKEIGWHEVCLTDQADQSPVVSSVLPPRFTVFQWHGDTFQIPSGAVHLAENRACSNQAFQYGSHVLALQFHLEYTKESIEKMLYFCEDELVEGPCIQKPQVIRAGYKQIPAAQKYFFSLLDAWVRKA
jgi:GMP synthase-like glutamine amidotransferase